MSPSPSPGAGSRGWVSKLGLGPPRVGRGARRLSSCRGDAVTQLLDTDASGIAPPRQDRGPRDCGRRAWEKRRARPGDNSPPVELSGRRQVERGPQHQRQEEVHVPRRGPGARAAARGDQAGVLRAKERRARLLGSPGSCGRRGCCCRPRRRAARRATRAGLLRGSGSPSGSLPAREVLQGESRRLQGGAGGARALHSPPSRPPARARGEGAWPFGGKLAGGGAAGKAASLGGQPSPASARLGGTLQARPGRGKQGAPQEG